MSGDIATPHRLASLQAHLRGHHLDRELAAGVETWRTPVHAARSIQLTSTAMRDRLARSLDQVLQDADASPRASLSIVVHACREAVIQVRPAIVSIADRLRSDEPLAARGVAALLDLLTDGGGPLYVHADPRALEQRLDEIDDWLCVPR